MIKINFISRYDGSGRLERIVAGDRMSEYHYTEGNIGYIQHSRDGVSVRTSFHHNKANITFMEFICILNNELNRSNKVIIPTNNLLPHFSIFGKVGSALLSS